MARQGTHVAFAGDFSVAATTDEARRAGFLCVIWSLLTCGNSHHAAISRRVTGLTNQKSMVIHALPS